jgi:4'-phosphopantetheinyl transferase
MTGAREAHRFRVAEAMRSPSRAPRNLAELLFVPIADTPRRVVRSLPRSESRRARRIKDAASRAQFVAARYALRQLLSKRLGVQPSALEILARPGRAPELLHSRWRFSLSHSGSLCMIGLSRARRIGVDLEAVREIPDVQTFAGRYLHPTERDWLSSRTATRRSLEFLRIWVRKEAVTKAAGSGLAMRLDNWHALPPQGNQVRFVVVDGIGQRWQVQDLRCGSGFVAAVAVSTQRTSPQGLSTSVVSSPM